MNSAAYSPFWDGKKSGIEPTKLIFFIKKIFAALFSFANAKIILIIFIFFIADPANAATRTSVASGGWNNIATWTSGIIPAAGDDVIITTGTTVTIDVNPNSIVNLTVNGTLVIGNNNTDRTVQITGMITISSTGNFYTAGNGGNSISTSGNIINNGLFDMNVGAATATINFIGTINQTVSGTGTTNDFFRATINNTGAANNNIIEIVSSNFSAAAGFLTLTRGIIKMSGSYSFTNTFFNTTTPVINSDEGIWINNANVIVSGQNGTTQLSGMMRISAGIYNIGVAGDYSLTYNSGAILTIEGGAINISGAFLGTTSSASITYTQTGGTMSVCTVANNNPYASFGIEAAASVFIMSGGSIVAQKPGAVTYDYLNNAGTNTVTGGLVQMGHATTLAGSLFWIRGTAPIYNLTLNASNNPSLEIQSNIIVLNDITIGAVLDATAANFSISVAHDWINNGSFVQRSATVTFNGTAAQQISGANATTFHNLTINKTNGGLTVNKTASVNGTVLFTAGVVNTTATSLLIFNDNAIATGANNGSTPSYVHGPVRKIGNDAFTFPVGKTGAGYRYCAISAPSLATDAFTAEFMRASATLLGPIAASGLYTVSNCEYWKIDRSTGSSNVDVTLSWNGLSNCNAAIYVNNLSALVVAHFNGTNWDSYGSNSTTGNASAGSVTWNNVSSFSPFSIGSNSITANLLPVKFSAVKAYTSGVDNTIEWTNETEEGVDHYEIEKSIDGNLFASNHTIIPKMNNGTKSSYNIADHSVNDKTCWYRIKAVESNGNSMYSSIVKVSREHVNDMQLELFPNPVTGKRFTIQLKSRIKTNYTMHIINQSGQTILTNGWKSNGGFESRMITLPSSTATGVYMIRLTGDGNTICSKFLIQ